MALPKITQIIQDGSLGIVPPSPANVVAKLGVCSSGTVNTVQQFSGPSVKVIKDALGTGPLAEAAAHSLEIAGGPVTAVPEPRRSGGCTWTVMLVLLRGAAVLVAVTT